MIFEKISEKGLAYLNGTFVQVNGDLYYAATGAGNRIDLYSYSDLLARGGPSVSITDKNSKSFSFLSPVLGYFYVDKMQRRNYPFLSRISSRSWKTGICEANVDPNNLFGVENSETILKGLYNIQTRNYLGFADALDVSRDYNLAVPFHRRYAVFKDEVFYKGERLGKIQSMVIKVPTPMSATFHTEHLESLTGCRCICEKPREIRFGKEDI